MKKSIILITFLCHLMAGFAQQADFQKAVARYKNTTSVTATATKTTHRQAVAKDAVTKGQLTMKRPSTVSIVMEGGKDQLLMQGSTFTMVVKGKKHTTSSEKNVQFASFQTVFESILSGGAKDISKLGDLTINKEGNALVLTITPKAEDKKASNAGKEDDSFFGDMDSDLRALFDAPEDKPEEDAKKPEPTNKPIPTVFDTSPAGETIPLKMEDDPFAGLFNDFNEEAVHGTQEKPADDDGFNFFDDVFEDDVQAQYNDNLDVNDILLVQEDDEALVRLKKKPVIVRCETALSTAIIAGMSEGWLARENMVSILFGERELSPADASGAKTVHDTMSDVFEKNAGDEAKAAYAEFLQFPFNVRLSTIILTKHDIEALLK